MPHLASFRCFRGILALALVTAGALSTAAMAASGGKGKNASKVATCPEKSPPFCAAWTLCTKGDILACNDIGVRYERGISVKVSLPKAIAYYSKSCTKKVKAGCFAAARLLLNNKDKASSGRAFQLLKSGCGPSRPRACAILSWMYLHGQGTSKDLTQAKASGGIACQKHIRRGCYVVNNVLLLQAKTAAEKALAVKQLDAQCVQGYGLACIALSVAYKSGLLTADLKKTQHYLLKGCEANDGHSCFQLATLRKSQNASKAELFSLYERACVGKHPMACAEAKKLKKALSPNRDQGPSTKPATPPTTRPGAAPGLAPTNARPAPRQPTPRR